MRLFCIKLAGFALLFIVMIGSCIFASNAIIDSGDYYKIPESKYFVILGHSHPECAINDSLVDHCINLSKSGESYLYTYIKAKKLLEENKHIKALFIEYTNNQIRPVMDEWIYGSKYISYRYPQYSTIMDWPEQRYLLQKNIKSIISNQSKSLVSNSSFLFDVMVRHKKSYFINNGMGGYRYLIRDKTDSLVRAGAGNVERKDTNGISTENIHYLLKIVNLCKKAKVHVYLIRSPLHKTLKENNERLYKEVLDRNFSDVPYLDFRNYKVSDSCFGDLEHLNHKGAKIFSTEFNKAVKKNQL